MQQPKVTTPTDINVHSQTFWNSFFLYICSGANNDVDPDITAKSQPNSNRPGVA